MSIKYSLSLNTKCGGRVISINKEGVKIFLCENREEEDELQDAFDILDMSDIRKLAGRKLLTFEIHKLKRCLQERKVPDDEALETIYNKVLTDLRSKNSKEIHFHDGSNMLYPSTQRRNRIYCSGATGCGKSTFIGEYLKVYRSVHPDNKFVLFSDIDPEDDKILEKHKPLRIKLNQSLVDNPIQTPELQDTITCFDDIDSISNKKIKEAVISLYNSILKKGSSKNNIETIITNHAMSDYRATRDILINSNFIVFFTNSPQGVDYTLKKFSLTNEQIIKMMNLPSRWVALNINAPLYVVHQNGAYLV